MQHAYEACYHYRVPCRPRHDRRRSRVQPYTTLWTTDTSLPRSPQNAANNPTLATERFSYRPLSVEPCVTTGTDRVAGNESHPMGCQNPTTMNTCSLTRTISSESLRLNLNRIRETSQTSNGQHAKYRRLIRTCPRVSGFCTLESDQCLADVAVFVESIPRR
jgi:hypothetical protein